MCRIGSEAVRPRKGGSRTARSRPLAWDCHAGESRLTARQLTIFPERGILFLAPLGRSLAVERLTLDQVGGVRIPAPQPLFFPFVTGN